MAHIDLQSQTIMVAGQFLSNASGTKFPIEAGADVQNNGTATNHGEFQMIIYSRPWWGAEDWDIQLRTQPKLPNLWGSGIRVFVRLAPNDVTSQVFQGLKDYTEVTSTYTTLMTARRINSHKTYVVRFQFLIKNISLIYPTWQFENYVKFKLIPTLSK